MPISFGTQSARIWPFEGSSLRFDPATGVNSYRVTTETFTVSLGEFTSEESQKVNGNLTGRPSGIYSSSINRHRHVAVTS